MTHDSICECHHCFQADLRELLKTRALLKTAEERIKLLEAVADTGRRLALQPPMGTILSMHDYWAFQMALEALNEYEFST